MSRSLLSATQRVVDKGFRNGAFTPKPAMVLDTRDGVYEAAANGLGVGFIWEFGSSREDRIRKLRVIDFEQGHPEHIFHLAGRASPLIAGFETIQLLAPMYGPAAFHNGIGAVTEVAHMYPAYWSARGPWP